MQTHNLLLWLGASGVWLVEASYLPQIVRLFRLKESDEFSFLFPTINIFGRLAGIAASVAGGNAMLGWFFVVGIVLRLVLLSQVVYYRGKRRPGEVDRTPVGAAQLSI